jgi:hypothetical protein
VGRTIWHIGLKNPNHEANVQIEKKQNRSTPSSFAAKSSGTKVAQEYAATFSTRLALARWTRGGDIPHVHCFEHQLPMRAAWYEQAQRRFQDWLEAGGFHVPEPGCFDSVIAEATQRADENSLLSRKVVVHGGPRTASRPAGAPEANGAVCDDGADTRDRQAASGMASSFSGMKSFPDTPGSGRRK